MKETMKKEGVGGAIILHEPGFSEFYNCFDPTYSCMNRQKDGSIRIKTNYNGWTQEKKIKDIRNTANYVHHMCHNLGESFIRFKKVDELLKSKFDINHYGMGSSYHNEQNN